MISSIERMFGLSQVDRASLPNKRMRDWHGSNLRERAKRLGLEDAYDAVFSGGSLIVHGSWGDLFQHHLEPHGTRFRAKTDFKQPRPQFLEVNALFSVRTVSEFINFLGLYQERQALQGIFDEFCDRLQLLSQLHERFLEKN